MAEKKRFEQLLRPVYEARAAIAWAFACVWMAGVSIALEAPKLALVACALLALSMTGLRFLSANRLLKYKMSLLGLPTVIMPATRLKNSMDKLGNNLWLGWGYRWEPRHTQRAYEIMKRDLEDVYPPPWWLKWRGDKRDPLQSCVFRSLMDTQFGFSWTAGTVGTGHPVRLPWTRAVCYQLASILRLPVAM